MTKQKTSGIVTTKTRRYVYILAVGLAIGLAILFTYQSIAANDALSLSYKAASATTVKYGEQLTYSIHLVNNSTTEANANVSDKIPAELAYVAGTVSHNGVYNSDTKLMTWDNVKVPGSGEVVLTFDVTPAMDVTDNVDVVNKVSIQLIGEDGLGQILTRAVQVSLVPGGVVEPPLLNAFKTASQAQMSPGDILTYTIQVTNSGIQDATVDVTDPLPREMKYVDGSVSGNGSYDPNTRIVSWEDVSVPAASETLLTFQVESAIETVSEPIEVLNIATVSGEGQVIEAEAKVMIVPKVLSPDKVQPVVNKVQIGDQDVVTDPKVTIKIDASADATWMIVREYTVKMVYGQPVWAKVKSSEWAPFKASFQWDLVPNSGVHYIVALVADDNMNRSLLSSNAMDFVSLNLPNTTTDKPGLIPYQVFYKSQVQVNIQLAPSKGNADLYVWYPDNFEMPDQSSVLAGTALDQVSFTTPEAGVYIILVHAVEPVAYNLSITPPGGPNGTATANPNNSEPNTSTDGVFTTEPVFSKIGVNPLGVVEQVGGPYLIRLPIIIK